MLYSVVSAVQQSESVIQYVHPLIFGFPSHLGHHRALRRVPCAIQQVIYLYIVLMCISVNESESIGLNIVCYVIKLNFSDSIGEF